MVFARFFFLRQRGPLGPENLDSPLSNFDVVGIPTGSWSSSWFACWENVLPSCVLSFFCPCIMWSQVVVRAQVPLLISTKNSFTCFRGDSGYGTFIDYFTLSLLLCIICIIIIVAVPSLNTQVMWLLVAIILFVGGTLAFALGHTRTAIKEKYKIAECFPPGWQGWEMLWDGVFTVLCLPCSLAQMARHVFQYDRMDTKLGLFVGDPTTLPPLRPDLEAGNSVADRPERADRAGLVWTENGRHPNAKNNTGAAHRQQEIRERQEAQMRAEAARANASAPVYNADGSRARV